MEPRRDWLLGAVGSCKNLWIGRTYWQWNLCTTTFLLVREEEEVRSGEGKQHDSTKVNRKRRGGSAPLQAVVGTMVKQDAPLQLMRSTENTEIHSQPVREVHTPEQVDARESCDPEGDPNGERGPLLPQIEERALASKLEQPILKGLHPMDEWLTALLERLFAHGRDSHCSSLGRTDARTIWAMLEKFMENCLSWETPHGTAGERLPSQSKQKKDLGWWTNQNPHMLSSCAVSGNKGWVGGVEGKAYFTSHYPSLTLLTIYFPHSFKFEPILPLECFLPIFIWTHESFINFLSRSSAQL